MTKLVFPLTVCHGAQPCALADACTLASCPGLMVLQMF